MTADVRVLEGSERALLHSNKFTNSEYGLWTDVSNSMLIHAHQANILEFRSPRAGC